MITERGRQLVHGLAGAVLAAVLLAVSGAAVGDSGPDDRWLSLRGAAALEAAPCPSDTAIALPTVSPARLDGRPRTPLLGLRPEAD